MAIQKNKHLVLCSVDLSERVSGESRQSVSQSVRLQELHTDQMFITPTTPSDFHDFITDTADTQRDPNVIVEHTEQRNITRKCFVFGEN